MNIITTLDNGHGSNYIGKWSPVILNNPDIKIIDMDCIDNTGRFREYLFNRKIIKMLYDKLLSDTDFTPFIIVPEYYDISLSDRKARINKINPHLSLSMHADAVGSGNQFEKARGFAIWTSRGKTISDIYAGFFYNAFEDYFINDEEIKKLFNSDIKIRCDYSDGDKDYENNFAMLMVKCPALLIETMFYTNITDVQIMMLEYFQMNYVKALYNGYVKMYNYLI